MVLLSIEEKIVPVDIIRPLAQDENSSTIKVLGSTNNIDRALVRQPIAVSDISVYICLIDIKSKSKEQLNERRAGLSSFSGHR